MKVIIISFICLWYICDSSQASTLPLVFPTMKNTTVLGQATSGKLYVLDNRMVKWNNARLACESSELVLATIEDETENREVYAFLSNFEGPADVWTAGNDIYENGKYVWGTDGDSEITYFDWITGSAPNDPTCGCISIVRGSRPCDLPKCTGWKEVVCSESRKTLCMLSLN